MRQSEKAAATDGVIPENQPLVRLVVYLRDVEERSLAIEFWQRELLESQLRIFEKRRGCGRPIWPEDLHAFSNLRGQTVAFSDDRYLRHELVELSSPRRADAVESAPSDGQS